MPALEVAAGLGTSVLLAGDRHTANTWDTEPEIHPLQGKSACSPDYRLRMRDRMVVACRAPGCSCQEVDSSGLEKEEDILKNIRQSMKKYLKLNKPAKGSESTGYVLSGI